MNLNSINGLSASYPSAVPNTALQGSNFSSLSSINITVSSVVSNK
jgi:hypothetical protein